MRTERSIFRWASALLTGLAVTFLALGLLRYGERSVRAQLEEDARYDALAAANAAAHAIQIYTDERVAEAAYLSDLCGEGRVLSQADFMGFTHTIVRSHGEYRGILWRAANRPDTWARPERCDPILPAAIPAIESALQAVRDSASSLEKTRVIVGLEPGAGRSVLGILRSTAGREPSRAGLIYAELGTECLDEILSIPFFQDRYGCRVEVDGASLWGTGGTMPTAPPPGTYAELRTALVGEQMSIHVWFLPQNHPDPVRTLRGLRIAALVVSLLAGAGAGVAVGLAQRERRSGVVV